MPIAIVVGAAPDRDVHRAAEACRSIVDEMAVAGGARRRADPHGALPHHRSRRAGGCRDRHRGLDRSATCWSRRRRSARATAMSRSKPSTCRCRSPRSRTRRSRCSPQIISQVTPSESSVIKKVAYEPLFLAHLKTQLGVKGIRRVVMHERLTNLRPVIFLQFAAGTPRTEVWRGLNGASTLQSNCGKIVIAVSEDIDPVEHGRGAVVARLSQQSDRRHAHRAQSRRRAGRAIRPATRPTSGLLVDATRKRPMPPLALPKKRIHGARARRCGRSWPAGGQRAVAVARLRAR